jgi:hypothetical protein
VALVAISGGVFWARRGKRELALAVILTATYAYSFQQIRWMASLSNETQIAGMRTVHAQTDNATRVLDGFTGLAWFRPSATYFGFLHEGVQRFMPAAEKRSIVVMLETCESAPDLVFLDRSLRALSPEVEVLVSRGYRESDIRDTWIRDENRWSHCSRVAK